MSRHKASRDGPTVEFSVSFANGHRGRRCMEHGGPPAADSVEPGNIPRVARLLALAHRMEGLVRTAAVRDYAELARLGGVSRSRISQIVGLLGLAPDIQEEILFLPRTVKGQDPIHERHIRRIASEADWDAQRQMAGTLGSSVRLPPRLPRSSTATGGP